MMSGSDFIRIISSLRVYFLWKKPQHSSNHLLIEYSELVIDNQHSVVISLRDMYPSLLVVDFEKHLVSFINGGVLTN